MTELYVLLLRLIEQSVLIAPCFYGHPIFSNIIMSFIKFNKNKNSNILSRIIKHNIIIFLIFQPHEKYLLNFTKIKNMLLTF